MRQVPLVEDQSRTFCQARQQPPARHRFADAARRASLPRAYRKPRNATLLKSETVRVHHYQAPATWCTVIIYCAQVIMKTQLIRPFARGLQPTHARRSISSWSTLRDAKARGAPIDIHPEVEDALAHNKPVVALETALVTHGLPYPLGVEVPINMENNVRASGAVPATIGLVQGRVKIGLERHELDRLADRNASKPVKVSRRDIAVAIAQGADGGTTCSATLIFSALAGIKVFATGGLGGVHRGGQDSMDVSADLYELSRCPVGLVSSGMKSILDIKRTLEYLETLGVPVVPFSKSREFPAFFCRRSGNFVPWNVEDPLAAAKLLHTQGQLAMQNGALISVPMPEQYEEISEKLQKWTDQAVLESEQNGMSESGNDVTPWLLDRIKELSGGTSLEANIALLENNAIIGGQIAVELHKLEQSSHSVGRSALLHPDIGNSDRKEKSLPAPSTLQHLPGHVNANAQKSLPSPANVVVIGAAAVDITAQELSSVNAALARHSTAPGHVRVSLGGVARNIAEASHRIMQAKFPQLSTLLLAPVGRDAFGHLLVDELSEFNMRTDGLISTGKETAICNMVLDSTGALVGGVADMSIMDSVKGEDVITELQIHKPSVVALDANLTAEAIAEIVQYCHRHHIPVLFEPTSTIKATRILPAIQSTIKANSHLPIAYCTPNLLELTQLYETAQSDLYELMEHPVWWDTIDSINLSSAFRMDLEQLARKPVSDDGASSGSLAFLVDEGVAQKALHLLPFFQNLIIKCGAEGVVVLMRIDPRDAAQSGWVDLRSNPHHQRNVVAHGKAKEIVVLQHIPPMMVDSLANVTGAGDSFVGALVSALADNPCALHHPKSLHKTLTTAQKAAVLTLQSQAAVSPLLSLIDKV